VALSASQLFGVNTTRLALRQRAQPRRFTLDFAQLLSPSLTPDLVAAASREDGESYAI
jgi:hypothetical protein